MALVLYECQPDFPQKIPDVLTAEGLTVAATTKRIEKVRPGEKDFAYIVSDGSSELHLSGGFEDDGFVFFFIASPWSWHPRVVRTHRLFYDLVSAALLRAGTRIWDDKT